MTSSHDERDSITLGIIKNGDDWAAKFVIDGRDYDTSDAVRADIGDAGDFLDIRNIRAEFRSHRLTPNEPKSNLPTWPQYKQAFLDREGTAE